MFFYKYNLTCIRSDLRISGTCPVALKRLKYRETFKIPLTNIWREEVRLYTRVQDVADKFKHVEKWP